MDIDEQIAILQAAKAGKDLQLATRVYNPRRWVDLSFNGHRFNFSTYDYRLKPKPLILYANVYQGGDSEAYVGVAISSDRKAVLDAPGSLIAVRRGAKFVEVIE